MDAFCGLNSAPDSFDTGQQNPCMKGTLTSQNLPIMAAESKSDWQKVSQGGTTKPRFATLARD